jgi:hypothetical protein
MRVTTPLLETVNHSTEEDLSVDPVKQENLLGYEMLEDGTEFQKKKV